MNKKEFLDILRHTLSGEVSSEVIDQNMKYYDQYISSGSLRVEEIIEQLGDPRLIARTIIETDRIAKQKRKYTGSTESSYRHYDEEDNENSNHNTKEREKTVFYTNLSWRQKLTVALIIIAILLILVLVGRLIIGFLFAFGVPILLVLLLMALFKKRN